ncbi:ATP-binding protein [Candidatus Gracilibacteria bacterium]|nr:ATP-binding protein [Candidatus Gracilibacteria bacterium]
MEFRRNISTEGGDYAERGDIHKEQGIIITEHGLLVAEMVVGVVHNHVMMTSQPLNRQAIPVGTFARVGIPVQASTYALHTAALEHLRLLVLRDAPLQMVYLHGMPGMGKSALVARLANAIGPQQFQNGVLWCDLEKLTPHELMARMLLILDGPGAVTTPQAHVPLRELFWQRLTNDAGSWLLVFDHVATAQQLTELLPPRPEEVGKCRTIIIGNNGSLTLPKVWNYERVHLKQMYFADAEAIYADVLGKERTAHFSSTLAEIVEALDYNLQLILTSAYLFQSGSSTPPRYLERLKQHDGQRTQLSNQLVDHLELVVQGLTVSQQHLFDCTGVLGEGDWNSHLLAAVAMQHPEEILAELKVLVETNILDYRLDPRTPVHADGLSVDEQSFTLDSRFRAGTLARSLALRRLAAKGVYQLRAAQTLMARHCLDHAEDLVVELSARLVRQGDPKRLMELSSERFVRSYRAGIATEMPHLRQALNWAIACEDWQLVRRFAALPHAALLLHFSANGFDITLKLVMGTIVEPNVWPQGAVSFVRSPVLVQPDSWSIHPETRPATADDAVLAGGATLVGANPNIPIAECELNWHLTACHIVDGMFRNTCFTGSQ